MKALKNTNFHLHYGDVVPNNINSLIIKIKPDEIYNLAAQSHVRVSFDIKLPQILCLRGLNILESIRQNKLKINVNFIKHQQ